VGVNRGKGEEGGYLGKLTGFFIVYDRDQTSGL
jgi:hypothetical protein